MDGGENGRRGRRVSGRGIDVINADEVGCLEVEDEQGARSVSRIEE